jgi:hypothetical protein
MQNLKWYTAVIANHVLDWERQFWQHDSYDHLVRKEEPLTRIIFYVLQNPMKAGLVAMWQPWPWSYTRVGYVDF